MEKKKEEIKTEKKEKTKNNNRAELFKKEEFIGLDEIIEKNGQDEEKKESYEYEKHKKEEDEKKIKGDSEKKGFKKVKRMGHRDGDTKNLVFEKGDRKNETSKSDDRAEESLPEKREGEEMKEETKEETKKEIKEKYEEGKEKYTAEQIKILRDLEAVRKRPAMYIGSTGTSGLHHLIWEIVDNSVDEALAGFCDKIVVRLLEDNGRGIPIDIHPETGTSALEVVFTKLHAGGKFEKGVYKVSGGLHGVGASVVNALSEQLEVWVKRDGKLVYQKFKRGKPVHPPKVKSENVNETGTRVRFKPDPEIFETTKFSYETVSERLKALSYLIPGLKIILHDKREDKREVFQSKDGIEGLVSELVSQQTSLLRKPIKIEGEKDEVEVNVALTYKEEPGETVISFANTVKTQDGGTHETGFRAALTRVINQFAEKVLKKSVNFSGDDVREGLVACISVFIPDPQFEGQTKAKLGNTKVRNIVESLVYDRLLKVFESNPKIADIVVKRVWQTHIEREAERKAREIVRRRTKDEMVLPGKLADCQEKDPSKTEIFLVEGESAGGSAKQARDRKFQAILPLRGKILNVEKASLIKMLNHDEIQAIISALGCGIGKECSPEKLRYGKIIILSDADIDGSHIKTLLLTFFWKYMRPIVEANHIFIAQPPLYRVREKNQDIYLRDDHELKEYIIARGIRKMQDGTNKKINLNLNRKDSREFEKEIIQIAKDILKGKKDKPSQYGISDPEKFIREAEEVGKENIIIQRFKGLGEMNPSQLWETTMNPSTRTLKKVSVEDAIRAEELFTILMGDKVEPRREFIVKHAIEAETLDI